jgi:hypothetical protein
VVLGPAIVKIAQCTREEERLALSQSMLLFCLLVLSTTMILQKFTINVTLANEGCSGS